MFFGGVIGRRAHWVAVSALAGSFVASCSLFSTVASGGSFTATLFSWIVAGDFETAVTAHVDPLTVVMLLVVTGVGALIHLYSAGYMHGDPGYARYFAYLNLFVFSMTMLVLAGNYLLLYVFWEAVGLCSYLLIGFWYTRPSAAQAGKKAFIVNRVGDFGFGLGIMWLWTALGTLDYGDVFKRAGELSPATATGIALLLFVGACGKSAQLPLHTWLPDAMEGPTPVSALIHAATMVTAGVYMVARSHALFERSGTALEVVAWVGTATALFAATIGLVQPDIKRVLAYSTVSQLGYMFAAIGLGAYAAGIFHLVTHAFFKALLFLGAGSVIHGLGGEQDMERMGGLGTRMRITFVTMAAGTLAIAGVPPFSGFFSKDEILWGAWEARPVLAAIGLFVAFLTAFYMGRLFCMTFFGECRASEDVQRHIHESPAVMTLPLVLLAVLACAGGFLDVPGLLAGEAHPAHAPLAFMLLATALAAGGLGLAWALYVKWPGLPSLVAWRLGAFYRLVRDKFRVDELYDAAVVRPVFALAEVSATRIDPQLIDGAVNGAGRVVSATSGAWRRFQTGNVQHYALSFLAGALALLGYWMTR